MPAEVSRQHLPEKSGHSSAAGLGVAAVPTYYTLFGFVRASSEESG